MSFLSREIVFLFPNNQNDMNSFFENLFTPKTNSIIGVPSNILASINVEISGAVCDNLNSFIFKYEGDKTLPFMDLLNTVTKIADFHGLDARFDSFSKKNRFNIPPLGKSLLRQFFGHLNSGHEYLLRYIIY